MPRPFQRRWGDGLSLSDAPAVELNLTGSSIAAATSSLVGSARLSAERIHAILFSLAASCPAVLRRA